MKTLDEDPKVVTDGEHVSCMWWKMPSRLVR
jgi:hypothetical protein